MSEPLRPERDWRLYVDDMIEFAERALEYTANLDRASFPVDRMRYDATLRNLELIGEAARRVPDECATPHRTFPSGR